MDSEAKAQIDFLKSVSDEYDAAQEKGDIAALGANQYSKGVLNGNTLISSADIGLTRKEIHEARAKMRLADEYDAAQERGEVGQTGRQKSVPNGNAFKIPTAADIGLTRKEIHEARELRKAENISPGIIEETLNTHVEMGVGAELQSHPTPERKRLVKT